MLNVSVCIYMCNAACSIAHRIICTRLFRGKMHSDWFNGIEILQGRWQHGEKVGYCYPRGLGKTLCKWDIYVPLVTKGLSLGCDTVYICRYVTMNASEQQAMTFCSIIPVTGSNKFLRYVGTYLPV